MKFALAPFFFQLPLFQGIICMHNLVIISLYVYPGSLIVPTAYQWSCVISWTLLRSVCVVSHAWTATSTTWPL